MENTQKTFIEKLLQRVAGRRPPVKERTKHFFLYLFAWDLLTAGSRKIYSLWLRLTHNREIIQNDTFEAACKRHGVTPERLGAIMRGLKANKRCYWVLAWVALFFWATGLYLISGHGFTLARLNMTMASLGLMAVFTVLNLKYTFRHWQCEIRRLGSLDEFWADAGILRILKW